MQEQVLASRRKGNLYPPDEPLCARNGEAGNSSRISSRISSSRVCRGCNSKRCVQVRDCVPGRKGSRAAAPAAAAATWMQLPATLYDREVPLGL
eukprot:1144704-Pelagomonas_calceolata.AAC.3